MRAYESRKTKSTELLHAIYIQKKAHVNDNFGICGAKDTSLCHVTGKYNTTTPNNVQISSKVASKNSIHK